MTCSYLFHCPVLQLSRREYCVEYYSYKVDTACDEEDVVPFDLKVVELLVRSVLPEQLLGHALGHDGTDHSAECPDTVADAHEDGGVPGGDVQVVDVETGDGEARATHGQNKGNGGNGLAVGVSDDEKEESLAAETATIEDLANIRRSPARGVKIQFARFWPELCTIDSLT